MLKQEKSIREKLPMSRFFCSRVSEVLFECITDKANVYSFSRRILFLDLKVRNQLLKFTLYS